MDSLKKLGTGVGKWIRKNVTGEKGVKPQDYTPVDETAREIKDHFDKMEDRVEKIEKDISKIGDLSELRPPKLSDVSDKQLVIAGATTGGAIGGALGMADGVIQTALDDPKIEVTKVEKTVTKPVLKGYDDKLIEDRDSSGMLKGYNHVFTPRIEYQKVGDYKVPEAKVTHTVDANSPVLEGVKGMVTGAVIGGALGLGVAVGRKVLKKGEYIPHEQREIEGEGKVIAASAGIGAVGGAAMGGLGAVIESGHSEVKDISWKQPVIEKTTIGQIPQDHYHSVYDVVHEADVPKRDVVVDAPKMKHGIFGEKPVMEKMHTTVEIKPRYGFLSQVLGGAVIGAIGGALLGVLVNVLRKII